MTELFGYTFFQNAIIGIVIISISAAIIGSYIVTRRLVAISGGVTHACFGGLGLGYYLGLNPILMASIFAVASSVGVEWMASRYKVREDSAIAVVWSLGMAIGVLFIFLTPGYVPELNSFLFGNILTITVSDLWAFGVYTIVLIVFFALFYRKIIACAFDRDFAQVMRLPVKFISYSMTVLIAVCIVLTIRLVGLMLLMSMLSLPQMISEIYCHKFKSMMFLSIAISMVCCLVGLFFTTIIDVPCSAIIVIVMVVTYIIARVTKQLSDCCKCNKA